MWRKIAVFVVLALSVEARKFNDPNVNFIDDPKSVSGIDFSRATPGPDGTLCVQRKKYVDKTEKDQLKECFVQNVTQCYYTYITEYTDGIQEKCKDFYWKTCKIVFKERVFNATSRSCKRPLIKDCDDGSSSGREPDIVCETFFETECNTTTVVPNPGDEPLDVTFCDKIPRKICAPDNCKVVEGPEECEERSDQSTIEHPIELCDLQPQKHCSQEKISVPRLIPEQKCRQVEKEICNTQMINPHDVKQPVFIKYCTRPNNIQSTKSTYLPPASPPTRYPSPTPQPQYGQPTPSSFPVAQPVRTAKSTFRLPLPNQPFGGQNIRQKREPEPVQEQPDSAYSVPAQTQSVKRQGRSLNQWSVQKSAKAQRRSDESWDPVVLTYT